MANNFASSPWVLDTLATPAYAGRIKLAAISWEGYGNPADEVELQDRRGVSIWAAVGKPDLSPVFSQLDDVWIDQLSLTKLSSGFVKVWII